MATNSTIVPRPIRPFSDDQVEERFELFNTRLRIAVYISDHPEVTYRVMASRLGCHPSALTKIARRFDLRPRVRRVTDFNVDALYQTEAAAT